jgi:hypothetical protein
MRLWGDTVLYDRAHGGTLLPVRIELSSILPTSLKDPVADGVSERLVPLSHSMP